MPVRDGYCVIRFGRYNIDLASHELRKNGRTVRLPAQAIQVLEILLERPGEVITREQLNERLWPNGTVVEFDHAINTCIRRLRAALNDSANQPRYIETLAKRGYRFIFPCEQRDGQIPGTTPSAPYQIGRRLGAGSMGIVYRATDVRLGRDVALKFPRDDWGDSQPILQAFEREAHAAAALNHPNVCTVHAFGELAGRPFIAMELLEGETLDALIRRRELTVNEVIAIARQMAAALGAAHAKGIVHRDIKPSNIFVLPGNAVKVMDFGVAKCPSRGTLQDGAATTDSRAGTLRYMAPEQLQGGVQDERSDIFSFGVVVYEMLTSRTPFDGDTAEALLSAIASSKLPSIAERRRSVAPLLAQVVSKCLKPHPALRWQSANELVTPLEALVKQATGPKDGNHGRRWDAWNRRSLGVVAGICLVLLVALGFYLHDSTPEPIDSIAVLPFADHALTGESDSVADGRITVFSP